MKYPTSLASFKRFMGKGGVLTLRQSVSSLEGKHETFAHVLIGVPMVAADATGSSLLLAPVDVEHDAPYTVQYGPASDWSFEGDLVYRETDDLWLAWEIDHA